MPYEDEPRRGSRIHPSNVSAIDRFLKTIAFITAVMGLFGVTLVSIFSFVLKTFRDPWQAATLAAIALLVISVSLAIKGSVYQQTVKRGLADEVSGRQALVERAQQYIQAASVSVSYIAGDFSSVNAIDQEIAAARNRNVVVRILGPNSPMLAVRANFTRAAALGCEVRLYNAGLRPVRVAIIDADAPGAEGAVLFVRKSKKGRKTTFQQSVKRNPSTDAEVEYVGTIYSDQMLVTAMGQLFDARWDMSEPFQ